MIGKISNILFRPFIPLITSGWIFSWGVGWAGAIGLPIGARAVPVMTPVDPIAADPIAAVDAVAANRPVVAPRFDLEQFQQGFCASGLAGVTHETISASDLTLPSLWWIRDQIAAQPVFGNKLIEKWLACPTPGAAGQIDILVNSQLWSLLDYWERYEAVHRLGTVAAGYGYNLRIFNRQPVFLAAYRCNQSPEATVLAAPLSCTLRLDSTSRGGVRSRPTAFDGGFPTAPGTGPP